MHSISDRLRNSQDAISPPAGARVGEHNDARLAQEQPAYEVVAHGPLLRDLVHGMVPLERGAVVQRLAP